MGKVVVRYISQAGRHAPGQPVSRQRQHRQIRQPAQFRPVSPRSTGCLRGTSTSRLARSPSSVRYRAGQLDSPRGSVMSDWRGSPSSTGISPVNWLSPQGQRPQVGEAPPIPPVSPQSTGCLQRATSSFSLARFPNSAGIAPSQLVVSEGQRSQIGQAAQLRPVSPRSTGSDIRDSSNSSSVRLPNSVLVSPRSTGCLRGTGH